MLQATSRRSPADLLRRAQRRWHGDGSEARPAPWSRLSTLVTLLLGTAALAPTAAVGQPAAEQRAHSAAHLIAYVRPGWSVELRDRPFGRVLARVDSTTPFGSPRALAVVATRGQGRWLGVTDPASGRNRPVWADASTSGLRLAGTSLELDVDLSRRTMLVRRDHTVIRHLSIGIGRPGSPTPIGRFAVTDKLDGRAYGPVYGCCIIALSAFQPRLPAGWRGGNRIAIHGTLSSTDLGAAVSAGCLHAGARDLRFLMRNVRLGTPVVIRP
jgi:L,D-transpeptidase catalytic domain